MKKFLGFDIGGTKCAVVVGDENGKIYKKIRFETTDYETTLHMLLETGEQLFSKDVVAIGISCGGPLNSKKGVIMSPPNLPGWDNVPIVKLLEDKFDRPTFLKNDADACAIAEWKWGAAKGYDNAVFLTCSTGMGAGLILNGKAYSGACDMAGEVGHIRLHEHGHIGYHKYGSFEGCCSGGGMSQYNRGSAKDLADAAKNGDEFALECYKNFGYDLGRGIAYIVDILNPEVVVIGSIYQRAQNLIEEHMYQTLKEEALPHSLENLKIVPSALGDSVGDMAAVGVAFDGYSQIEKGKQKCKNVDQKETKKNQNKEGKVKEIFQWIFKRLREVSTLPDETSYKWARRTHSVLASIILWTIWTLRLFSIYQWFKAIFRWLGKALKFGYVENDSGRPDVPPMFGELYFLGFTIWFSIAHHFGLEGGLLEIAVKYFLFESSLWIIYYTIFRRFFELGYTIYHQLEYILTIALLVPTQALCFSRVYSMSFKDTLASLLGAGGDNTPPILTIFGFFLGAIIIGMIISTFPTENIKKSVKKAKMYVVGCGDVVRNRLYHSLINSEYTVNVTTYDLQGANEVLPNCDACKDPDEIKEKLIKSINPSSIVWVETPPDSHKEYAELGLKEKAGLVVVEKPITNSMTDIEAFERMISNRNKRKKLFFLSYYVLEKALPLTFLSAIKNGDTVRSKFYKKYLEASNWSLVEKWQDIIGELESVQVHIYEGQDSRTWLHDNAMGGHLFETFIHNILIATQFCGSITTWENVQLSDADYTKDVHEISLTATGDIKIDLMMRKNSNEKSRTAHLKFKNGEIVADFDTKAVTISFDNLGVKCMLSVKEEYKTNYNILVDMAGRVYSNEAMSYEVDGLEYQIETLRWLQEVCR